MLLGAEDLVGMTPNSAEVKKKMLDSGCGAYDIEDEIRSMYLEICPNCGNYAKAANENMINFGLCSDCVD